MPSPPSPGPRPSRPSAVSSGRPYSDVKLLGGLAARAARAPLPASPIHHANGAAFGWAFERFLGGGVRRGIAAAEMENALLWPVLVVDGPDPSRPPLRRLAAARDEPARHRLRADDARALRRGPRRAHALACMRERRVPRAPGGRGSAGGAARAHGAVPREGARARLHGHRRRRQALKDAGIGEDEIFEQTVAAAMGQGLRRLDAAAAGHSDDPSRRPRPRPRARGGGRPRRLARANNGREPLGVDEDAALPARALRPSVLRGARRAMRGPSEWSPGERELFAGFVVAPQPVPLLSGLPRRSCVVRAR